MPVPVRPAEASIRLPCTRKSGFPCILLRCPRIPQSAWPPLLCLRTVLTRCCGAGLAILPPSGRPRAQARSTSPSDRRGLEAGPSQEDAAKAPAVRDAADSFDRDSEGKEADGLAAAAAAGSPKQQPIAPAAGIAATSSSSDGEDDKEEKGHAEEEKEDGGDRHPRPGDQGPDR